MGEVSRDEAANYNIIIELGKIVRYTDIVYKHTYTHTLTHTLIHT